DRGLDAFVSVGDDQLDAAQAAPGELPEEGYPEGLGFGGTNIHAEHLAPAIVVDADRDDDGDRDDAARMPLLHGGRVDQQIGPMTLGRRVADGLHSLLGPRAQRAVLALRDGAHAHGLYHMVD